MRKSIPRAAGFRGAPTSEQIDEIGPVEVRGWLRPPQGPDRRDLFARAADQHLPLTRESRSGSTLAQQPAEFRSCTAHSAQARLGRLTMV